MTDFTPGERLQEVREISQHKFMAPIYANGGCGFRIIVRIPLANIGISFWMDFSPAQVYATKDVAFAFNVARTIDRFFIYLYVSQHGTR